MKQHYNRRGDGRGKARGGDKAGGGDTALEGGPTKGRRTRPRHGSRGRNKVWWRRQHVYAPPMRHTPICTQGDPPADKSGTTGGGSDSSSDLVGEAADDAEGDDSGGGSRRSGAFGVDGYAA